MVEKPCFGGVAEDAVHMVWSTMLVPADVDAIEGNASAVHTSGGHVDHVPKKRD